jgi:hypothetical protein
MVRCEYPHLLSPIVFYHQKALSESALLLVAGMAGGNNRIITVEPFKNFHPFKKRLEKEKENCCKTPVNSNQGPPRPEAIYAPSTLGLQHKNKGEI